MKKEAAITVKDLHISYRGLKKFSIKRSFFKGKKNSNWDHYRAENGGAKRVEYHGGSRD